MEAVTLVYETHSITEDNENGFATGWLPGRLSTEGKLRAEELGRRRRDDGLALVFTSDLARAVETAAIAFDGSGIEVREDARLRECNYGECNGMRVDDMHRARRERIDEPWPGGESYRDVVKRMRSFLDDLREPWAGRRVLLIGHAATRFSLDHLIHGKPLEDLVDAPFNWQEGWEYRLY